MIVYFKGEESVCITHRDLLVKDIGTVYCSSPEFTYQVENLKLYQFPKGSKCERSVFDCQSLREDQRD